MRFIARSPLVRPILAATATLNVFTFAISALFVLVRDARSLGVSLATLGIVLGAGAIGGVLGSRR